jgi:TIR domain/Domain of unknown function (DUF5679)
MTDEFEHLEDEEDNEAYCVRCRHKVTMVHPEAVWTAKGTPGTRGLCPDCGTVVFRMGKTAAHDSLVRPAAVRVEGGTKTAVGGGRKRAQPATYISYASPDAEFASRLASDLENAGIHTWIDTNQSGSNDIKWAGGIHPALKDSAQMVVVLSSAAKDSEQLAQAWTFFKTQKKRITIALLDPVEAPDLLRRSARFDFSQDYIKAFRQLLSALSE